VSTRSLAALEVPGLEEFELSGLRIELPCLCAAAGCPDRAVRMDGHRIAAGVAVSLRPRIRDELGGVRIIAEPAPVRAIRNPHHTVGADLRIAEALAIRRGGARRGIDLDELERLGVEATDLAGALGHPGVALGTHPH